MHCTAAPAGALGEVVDGTDRDQAAGGLVDGDLDVDGVGAESPTWSAATARREQVHERLVGVGLDVAACASSAVTSSATGAEQVARMPRGIGTSSGVKLTDTASSVSAERFWVISGVCRCTPPTP